MDTNPNYTKIDETRVVFGYGSVKESSLPRKTVLTATVVGGLFSVIMLVGGIIAFHYKNPALGAIGTGLSPAPIVFSAIHLWEKKSELEEKIKNNHEVHQSY